jgi:hypothetical protein
MHPLSPSLYITLIKELLPTHRRLLHLCPSHWNPRDVLCLPLRLMPRTFTRRRLPHLPFLRSCTAQVTGPGPGPITPAKPSSSSYITSFLGTSTQGQSQALCRVQTIQEELHDVKCDAERRLRPFACGVSYCQRRCRSLEGPRTSLLRPIIASPFD